MGDYNLDAINGLLIKVFPDADEIEFFCDDYFKEVKFEPYLALEKRAQILSQYCAQNNQLDKLITLIQKISPVTYQEFSFSLLDSRTNSPDYLVNLSSIPPKTNAIFISYARRDLAFVTQLHQELTKRGVSAWFDKENIQVADQWTASIVEGIRDCKVFLLVLSPDSTASKNIRKEVDLAQRYDKRIVPLLWRTTDIPVAMEYQLAGIQWVDFKETASTENFNQLAEVLSRLVAGDSLTEATTDKSIAKESIIPSVQQLSSPKLGTLRKKQVVSVIAIGGRVISNLIISLDFDVADQDFVISELQWLFSAADHLVKVRLGEHDRSQGIGFPIPEEAIRNSESSNQILSTVDDDTLVMLEFEVENIFKRISTRLNNLNHYWNREVSLGEAARGDVYLQNSIKAQKIAIIQETRKLAAMMQQVYGILVTSPNQLIELLE